MHDLGTNFKTARRCRRRSPVLLDTQLSTSLLKQHRDFISDSRLVVLVRRDGQPSTNRVGHWGVSVESRFSVAVPGLGVAGGILDWECRTSQDSGKGSLTRPAIYSTIDRVPKPTVVYLYSVSKEGEKGLEVPRSGATTEQIHSIPPT